MKIRVNDEAIEMTHHPGDSYCVVEFRGTIPNWSMHGYAQKVLVSKQERILTDFVFQVMAWVPLHLIEIWGPIFFWTKIIVRVEHKVIK